jgi:hypothetical protein
MPTFTYECDNEAELAAVTRAARFASEMHQLALGAAGGEVLSAVEGLALDQGRRLLRDVLQGAAQARIDQDEKKGGPCAPAPSAPARSASRGGTPRT